MANPLPLVALASDNLSLTASFSMTNEDADYPAANLEDANPAKVAKSTTTSTTITVTTSNLSVKAVALFNTNAVTATVEGVGVTIPSVDVDGQRIHGWLDRRTSPLGPTTTWDIVLGRVSGAVWIGHIALLTDLDPLNLKYGLQVGRKRPGDTRHETRLGAVIVTGQQIRTRWAKGVVDLEEDETQIRNMEASAKGGVLPFILIPDEATNDAWLVRFASEFQLTYSNYGVREMPLSFDELSSGPPNG